MTIQIKSHKTTLPNGYAVDDNEEISLRIKAMENNLTHTQIAASEARTDAKFSELRRDMRAGFADLRADFQALSGKMDIVLVHLTRNEIQLDNLEQQIRSENHSTRKTFVVTAIATLVAIAVASISLLLAH